VNAWTPHADAKKRPVMVAIDNNSVICRDGARAPHNPANRDEEE
jgi:hypothetical protein